MYTVHLLVKPKNTKDTQEEKKTIIINDQLY